VTAFLCRPAFPTHIKKRLPGVGSEPGSSRINLFSHFHHFTAEPQRLPTIPTHIPHGGIQRCGKCGFLIYARSRAPMNIGTGCSGAPSLDI
jgi:hypothetical protein